MPENVCAPGSFRASITGLSQLRLWQCSCRRDKGVLPVQLGPNSVAAGEGFAAAAALASRAAFELPALPLLTTLAFRRGADGLCDSRVGAELEGLLFVLLVDEVFCLPIPFRGYENIGLAAQEYEQHLDFHSIGQRRKTGRGWLQLCPQAQGWLRNEWHWCLLLPG